MPRARVAACPGQRRVQRVPRARVAAGPRSGPGRAVASGQSRGFEAVDLVVKHCKIERVRSREIEASSMPYKFKEYDQNQLFLLPPNLAEWVPEDHVARFISDVVDMLDLSALNNSYAGALGQPAYEPRMILKVVFYSFSRGVFSSRKIEKATYDDVATRFLAANHHPDYSCFCSFRRRHKAALRGLFGQIVALCREAGICSLGHVAIDGTVVKGNASKSRTVKSIDIDEKIAADEKLVSELMKKWAQADDEDRGGGDLPKKLRKTKSRLEALRKAKKALDKQAEARYQKECSEYEAEEEARQQEYEQAAFEAKQQDEQAPELLARRLELGLTQEELSQKSGLKRSRVSQLESGYRAPNEIERRALAEALGVEELRFKKPRSFPRPLRDRARPVKRVPNTINLTDNDSSLLIRHSKKAQGFNSQAAVDADSQVIVGCLVSLDENDYANLIPTVESIKHTTGVLPEELSADTGYFTKENLKYLEQEEIDGFISLNPQHKGAKNPSPESRRMTEKMATELGKKKRTLRSCTVEPVFGQIKSSMGFTSFLTRGLDNVSTEWTMIAATHNLLKLFRASRK